VKYRGVAFECGDGVLIVPPLPLGIVRERSRVTPDTVPTVDENFARMTETIILAIRRNYTEQEVSADEITDLITVRNIQLLHSAARGTDQDALGNPFPFGHLARDPKEVRFVGGMAEYNPTA